MHAPVLAPAAVLAVDTDEAARITGVSRRVLREAVRANALVASYPTSKPVFTIAELNRWLGTLRAVLADDFRVHAADGAVLAELNWPGQTTATVLEWARRDHRADPGYYVAEPDHVTVWDRVSR